MEYDFETIPAKLFFKIQKTNDTSLLGENGEELWKEIIEEHKEVFGDDEEVNKTVDIYASIESQEAKLECIFHCIEFLRHQVDMELIAILQSFGFTVRWEHLQDDLDQVKKEKEVFEHAIKRLIKKLPKHKENDKSKDNFDKVVMSYAAIAEQGWINSNKITIGQYYALIETGNEKIKVVSNG